MAKQTFNLVSDPWLKVVSLATGRVETVSLQTMFEHADQYRQLAGDMSAQDLAILRLLLAILQSVYSRFDANDRVYDWLVIDQETLQVNEVDDDEYEDHGQDALMDTWRRLKQSRHFSVSLTHYLEQYKDRFDFFGDHPFYQVTASEYDAAVPAKKKIATGAGTVAIKQINRTVSESSNTPAIFAPKTKPQKNELAIDALVRWVITYQNFTGVTDKTKVSTAEKFSISKGWLYGLNPVFAEGNTLFDTLMLNLVLVDENQHGNYANEHPVWEYPDMTTYVDERKKMLEPTNVAAIYTALSRLLYIDWTSELSPTIFSAGLPMVDAQNVFIEPMTLWRQDTKEQSPVYKPATKSLRSLGIAMWRRFGQYVNVYHADDVHQPGIVDWLKKLKSAGFIQPSTEVTLRTVALVSDGMATSQAPAAEVSDRMVMKAGVLFDSNPDKAEHWPIRIEDAIDLSQQIGKDYWQFIRQISSIRGVNDPSLANNEGAKFYNQLNVPFVAWLASLSNDDDRDQKVNAWKTQLRRIALGQADTFIRTLSPLDIRGIVDKDKGEVRNVFTVMNQFQAQVKKHLAEGGRK